MLSKCPGSSKFRQPEPEIMSCLICNGELEIWTDEVKADCPHCKITIMREGRVMCLDWCKYARQCIGMRLYEKYLQNKKEREKKAQSDS